MELSAEDIKAILETAKLANENAKLIADNQVRLTSTIEDLTEIATSLIARIEALEGRGEPTED